TSSVQSASKVIEDKGKATISFRKSSSTKPRLSTSSSTQSFMSDKEKNLESDFPPCSHPTLVQDPNIDYLWCEKCQVLVQQKYIPKNGSHISMNTCFSSSFYQTLQKAKSVLNKVNVFMDTKEAISSQNDNDFPVAKDFEIYTEDQKHRRQYWYQ
ncbi:hypothetical protein KI387_017360, partial [Taxus chinensis]